MSIKASYRAAGFRSGSEQTYNRAMDGTILNSSAILGREKEV